LDLKAAGSGLGQQHAPRERLPLPAGPAGSVGDSGIDSPLSIQSDDDV